MEDDPGVLRDGGEPLPVPDEVNDTNTARNTGGISWISIGSRGAVWRITISEYKGDVINGKYINGERNGRLIGKMEPEEL